MNGASKSKTGRCPAISDQEILRIIQSIDKPEQRVTVRSLRMNLSPPGGTDRLARLIRYHNAQRAERLAEPSASSEISDANKFPNASEGVPEHTWNEISPEVMEQTVPSIAESAPACMPKHAAGAYKRRIKFLAPPDDAS